MGYEIAGAMGIKMAEPERDVICFTGDGTYMMATSVKVGSIAELEKALRKRDGIEGPYVIVIDTYPYPATEFGGTWWDVGVPEVSSRTEVNIARERYAENKKDRKRIDGRPDWHLRDRLAERRSARFDTGAGH